MSDGSSGSGGRARRVFTKRAAGAPSRALPWEAAGLAWLAEAVPAGGARIVEVLAVDEQQLTEVALESVAPGVAAAEDLGRALARTHLAGARGFGTGPDGWQGDGFIGPLPLPLTDSADLGWGEFYATLRLLPLARRAVDEGSLGSDGLRAVEQVCRRLVAGEFDDDRPAARIHGDLWSGNVLFTPDGVVLIDAAAHGGHAEADLAMLALFGAPQLDVIRAAWAEEYRPADGWREREALHQLHPLLVHAVLFGASYGAQAARVARRFT